MTRRDPVVFAGGCPRSGTTLLRNLLNAHPDLAIPNEAYFIGHVASQLVARGREQDLDLAWTLIRENRGFRSWNMDPTTVEQEMDVAPPSSFADLIRLLYAAYARSRGKSLAGDKTTDNIVLARWLAPLFPTARFIHVVRDPRSVCMSLPLQHWADGTLIGAAWAWRWHVQTAGRLTRLLGPRLLTVRYEDLVTHTEPTLRSVCRHVGLRFDPSMMANYGNDALAEHHHRFSRGPLRPGMRNWSESMSPRELALIEQVAKPGMLAHGYRLASTAPARLATRPDDLAYKVRSRLIRRAILRRRGRPWLSEVRADAERLLKLGGADPL